MELDKLAVVISAHGLGTHRIRKADAAFCADAANNVFRGAAEFILETAINLTAADHKPMITRGAAEYVLETAINLTAAGHESMIL